MPKDNAAVKAPIANKYHHGEKLVPRARSAWSQSSR
ncbi:hypothetical protein FHS18_003027 [Paenibacillus phyllosphaerae]|uniref:Uncharacterized protein n=1 Tax=Paenibacillus phyllosphaerae TaxID=274593 RepID=A0A7W5AY83_9BACL|nr:hypothetical protein [Paenibacillus phyllosphaerae]